MYLLIILFLITNVRTQQSTCSCACCTGQSCTPTQVGTFNVQSCTEESCRTQCSNAYPQCQANNPNTQIIPQCSSTVSPMYRCQCDCCRTGSPTCIPTFVGHTTAYSCQVGACSIECIKQYSAQCVSDQTGQTQGTCTGLITTTTTSTTTSGTSIGLWLGNTCRCLCCQSGAFCSPNIEVGITSASSCSSTACTQACQNQYPSSCPSLSDLGQTNGTCGNTRCQCQCCGTNGCSSYERNTNGECTTSCDATCRYQPPCTNTNSRLNQFYTSLKKNIATRRHSNTIRKYEPDFELLLFADIAQQRYIDAHQALIDRDEDRLIQLVTPGSFSGMGRGLRYKTLRWKWIEDIEPSYVVAVKSGEILKGMTMAQITIRMYSKQTCAIYDQNGRLMFGNDIVPKDVLEYIVFERVLTYPYSQRRVHSKILPTWLPPSSPVLYTFEKENIELLDESIPTDEIEDEKKRGQIVKEQETLTKTIPAPNELETPIPTISDISQNNKKRTIGYT